MKRRLPWLLVLLAIGCGPSAQDRYDKALDRLEKERTGLALLRPAYDEAVRRANHALMEQTAGAALEQILSGAEQQPGGIQLDSSGTNDDPFKLAEDLLTRQQTAQAELKEVGDAVKRAGEPGTEEHERIQKVLQADPDYQAYQRQLKRVERATGELEEAERLLERRR